MNSDTDIAAYLSIGPNVNGQKNLTGFVEFYSSIWWNTVGILYSYQCCKKALTIWIRVPYSS